MTLGIGDDKPWRRGPRVFAPLFLCCVVVLPLVGCGTDATRTGPSSLGLAAPDCTPGTFAGSMTGNCPTR